MSVYTKPFKWTDIKTESRFLHLPCARCDKVLGYLRVDANMPLPQLPIVFCSVECIDAIFSQSQQVTFYSVKQTGKQKNVSSTTS